MQQAATDGLRVKAVGAGHSFTAIGATDGVLLHLDHLSSILSHDAATGRVRVQAGISLHQLNPRLKALGLALPNLGDVDPQSVAGAISTGTHGTGGRLQGIAAAVVGVQLVLADGAVVEIDEQHPWFQAARVSLGALGIITEVTLQCVPAFLLHAREEPMALPEVLSRIDEMVEDNDHFEFYWFPHTEKTLIKRNNRVPAGTERDPVGRFRGWLDDRFLSNTLFEGINRAVAHRPPADSPRQPDQRIGDRRPRVHRRLVQRLRLRAHRAVPRVRVRHAPRGPARRARRAPGVVRRRPRADLVPHRGALHRTRRRVAVHRARPRQLLRGGAPVLAHRLPGVLRRDAGHLHGPRGTPALGQAAHARRERTSPTATPRFDDFVPIRDEVDPDRRFTNDYLDRVLS